MAWKKFRHAQRKYKKILYALFVRKGFRLFKNWRSLVPALRRERIEDACVRTFRLSAVLKAFRGTTLQMARDRFIILTISRRHFASLARLSLQCLRRLKDQRIENMAMARIMEERFVEKRASSILRSWLGQTKQRHERRQALGKLGFQAARRLKARFFSAIMEASADSRKEEAACRMHCANVEARALFSLMRQTDRARRGHVVRVGVQSRMKSEFFHLWRVVVEKRLKPLSIFTDSFAGEVVISPQSFQSFSLRHLVVPQWNEFFAEAKAEEWKRQKKLRSCLRSMQLEARNNVLARLFEAKLMR